MTVHDGLAYILEDYGSRLAIVDISDPASMTILGRADIHHFEATAIALHDRAAYISHGGNLLSVYDIHDPADLNGDGRVTFFDISLFFQSFNSGCP